MKASSPKTITLPTPLLLLYAHHRSRLPPLSHACASGVREALLQAGVPEASLPPLEAPPCRTSAATAARWRPKPGEASGKPGAE